MLYAEILGSWNSATESWRYGGHSGGSLSRGCLFVFYMVLCMTRETFRKIASFGKITGVLQTGADQGPSVRQLAHLLQEGSPVSGETGPALSYHDDQQEIISSGFHRLCRDIYALTRRERRRSSEFQDLVFWQSER